MYSCVLLWLRNAADDKLIVIRRQDDMFWIGSCLDHDARADKHTVQVGRVQVRRASSVLPKALTEVPANVEVKLEVDLFHVTSQSM